VKSGNLQEEFAPYASLRGSSTGVVARVESMTPFPAFPLKCPLRYTAGMLREGRRIEISKATRDDQLNM